MQPVLNSLSVTVLFHREPTVAPSVAAGVAQLAQLAQPILGWCAMASGRLPLKIRCHPERSEGSLIGRRERSLAALGMTLFSQLRRCEASAEIRHNIAQFCQERNVRTPREGILSHRRGRAIRTRTPWDDVNLRAMPAKCQHLPSRAVVRS